jgi:hypothetical protein
MKYGIMLLFIAQLFASCASNFGISKASAYVREKVAGTIRVDDSGRPLSSGVSEEHLLFIETEPTQTLPLFTTAWVKRKPYAVTLVEIQQSNESIGKTMKGEDVILSAKEGRKLWQLVLTPKQEVAAGSTSLAQKILEKQIVLTGTWKGEAFVYAFDKEEQLEPQHFQ